MKASIVIPSYNACERLHYNLLSLDMQSCSKDLFEVVVIDNGSSDDTWKMLHSYRPLFQMKKLHLQQNENRSKARNLGITNTMGEIIIFSDCDMISEKDFVEKHLNAHEKVNTVVCGVNWEKIYTYYYKGFKGAQEKSLMTQIEKYKLEMPLKVYKDKACLISEEQILDGSYRDYSFTYSTYDYGYNAVLQRHGNDLKGYHFPWSFFITNNCSASRENIIRAGMFDESYKGWGCEDLDLGYRLYKGGCSYKKVEITSLHQEHPARVAEDGMKNIYRFSEKYNEIDVLLFYFHDLIPIDFLRANEIINEINVLKDDSKYRFLLDTFKDLLKAARDLNYKEQTEKYSRMNRLKQICQGVQMKKKALTDLCEEVRTTYKCQCLADAFSALSRKIAKV